MLLALLAVVLLFVLGVFVFVNAAPQFGGSLTKEQKLAYESKEHFKAGKFLNIEEVDMTFDFSKMRKIFKAMRNPDALRSPKEDLEVLAVNPADIDLADSSSSFTWLGHSSVLVETDGKMLLIDPMFSMRPSPISFLGGKRFFENMPVEINELPAIDVVLISHDHYDHLDYRSIQELNDKVNYFIVPLGVDNHLIKWGVAPEKIKALDWWEAQEMAGIEFVFTPSKHFSGRGLTNRFSTLWGSWVINSKSDKIFFSGDSGYGSHFKEIGSKYGPFSLTMMECGQYNENWPDVHMMPEETVKAAEELGTKWVLPIHWGAFSLAPHSWTDPVERVRAAAIGSSVQITTPRIGETVQLNDMNYPEQAWWLK